MAAILQLNEAIGEFVRDGDTIALEGFTHLIPFAAGHEIIRQKRRGLTVIRMTPDVIYDQLIGAGCVAKIVFSWGGNPGVGSLHRLRDAIEKKSALEVTPEQALRTMRGVVLAQKSSREGRIVRWDEAV